ncbi:MAG: rhomboid family intramembrane serine protease [Flavobacteriales bacterium]|nr:rhomboid family intramembrane serine protease [Flavobacteriales bacterium]
MVFILIGLNYMNTVHSVSKKQDKASVRLFFFTSVLPVLLLLIPMFLLKFIESYYHLSFSDYGIFPRKISGLSGILFSPFIHGNWAHLINNAIPLFIMGIALFYFYKEIAWKTFFWIWIMQGIWTWLAARESFHVGASGILYGLFGFLLLSGIIRMNKALLIISLLVVLEYGSMVWGVFPIKYEISWESHLWGLAAGVALAFVFKKQGMQREIYKWEEDEEEVENSLNEIKISYEFIEKEKKEENL